MIVLLAVACTKAPEGQQSLPPPVASVVDALSAECAAAGGKANVRDAARRADLNGDGRSDFVVHAGWIPCDDAASVFGDRRKLLTVLIGEKGDGARQAYTSYVYDAAIEDHGSRPELWLTTSGEGCGHVPAATFSDEHFCDRQVVWMNMADRFELAPLATIRPPK